MDSPWSCFLPSEQKDRLNPSVSCFGLRSLLFGLFSLTLNAPWLQRALTQEDDITQRKYKTFTSDCHWPRSAASEEKLQPLCHYCLGNKRLWRKKKRDKSRGVNRGLNRTVYCCEIVHFLCQDKREINRRYWCWALGSLISLLLCHLSLFSLWTVIVEGVWWCVSCVSFCYACLSFLFLDRRLFWKKTQINKFPLSYITFTWIKCLYHH